MQNIKVWTRLDEMWAKVSFTESRGQIIWQQVKNSNKIRQDATTLISAFFDFWSLLQKNLFLQGYWVPGCASTQYWDFPCISEFSKVRSLNLFGNPWDNLNMKSIISTFATALNLYYVKNIQQTQSIKFNSLFKKNKKQREDSIKENPNNAIWNLMSPALWNEECHVLRYG